MKNSNIQDTIVALSTGDGQGAIGIVRLSGSKAIAICDAVFSSSSGRKKKLIDQPSHTIHFGNISLGDTIIDEVMVSIFKAPQSYTTEDVIEISCHGSSYIKEQLIRLMIDKGARLAKPGEFTMRAFLNGRIDLSQSEGVADLIVAQSASAHKTAFQQMRGGFSNEIKELRKQLLDFTSLIELELDFSEEDVEFADRKRLTELVDKIIIKVALLTDSFKLGNVIKNGVTTVIAGRPNAGKSTLLNQLVNEDRAIVSHIPGTTRDTIEELINIEGILFRLADTAGIRDETGEIESMGVEKTMDKISKAALIIYLFDIKEINVLTVKEDVKKMQELGGEVPVLIVGNKMDVGDVDSFNELDSVIFIAAKEGQHLDVLKKELVKSIAGEMESMEGTIVTNERHYDALKKAGSSLSAVKKGLQDNLTADLLAVDIRGALHYLGEITGEVTTEELLGNIFGKFCIGK